MRWTILAGLIVGTSLAIQSTVGAHARTKAGHAPSAVRAHAREIAPWYVATNVPGYSATYLADTRGASDEAKGRS